MIYCAIAVASLVMPSRDNFRFSPWRAVLVADIIDTHQQVLSAKASKLKKVCGAPGPLPGAHYCHCIIGLHNLVRLQVSIFIYDLAEKEAREDYCMTMCSVLKVALCEKLTADFSCDESAVA